ncbi:hypothetical protein D3C81_2023250 [compost metagenome]
MATAIRTQAEVGRLVQPLLQPNRRRGAEQFDLQLVRLVEGFVPFELTHRKTQGELGEGQGWAQARGAFHVVVHHTPLCLEVRDIEGTKH